MGDDAATDVAALADAYRFTLLEGDLREDMSATERLILLAVVAESADRAGERSPDGTLAQRLLPHLRTPAQDLTAVRVATRREALRAASREVARIVAPGWIGVVLGLAGAGVLWARPYGDLRVQGTVVVLTAALAGLSALLVLLTTRSRRFVAELGSTGGSVLTRASTVGSHAERLFHERVGPALRATMGEDASRSSPTVLLLVRLRTRAALRRLCGAALLAAPALFLGMTRALGLL